MARSIVPLASAEGEAVTQANQPDKRRNRSLGVVSAFQAESLNTILVQLKVLLTDGFSLHAKTSCFHSHAASLYSADYRRLLKEQADQIFAMTRGIVATIRNLGGRATARENEDIAKEPQPAELGIMFRELREDNAALMMRMIQLYDLCDDTNDLATAESLQTWIDETQRRVWFLGDTSESLGSKSLQ